MRPVPVVGKLHTLHLRAKHADQIPVSLSNDNTLSSQGELRGVDDRYRLTRFRTITRRAVAALPPFWREQVAEHFLRRAGAPGPAAEHVVQYPLSAAKSKRKNHPLAEATVAKGADNFYDRQYRQYFNPTMGAFAMTATQALLGSGGPPRGLLWWHRRKTYAAMLDESTGAPPILVIGRETVAVPLLLPLPRDRQERTAILRWLGGRGGMPSCYRELVAGEEVHCAEPHVNARAGCRRCPTRSRGLRGPRAAARSSRRQFSRSWKADVQHQRGRRGSSR